MTQAEAQRAAEEKHGPDVYCAQSQTPGQHPFRICMPRRFGRGYVTLGSGTTWEEALADASRFARRV